MYRRLAAIVNTRRASQLRPRLPLSTRAPANIHANNNNNNNRVATICNISRRNLTAAAAAQQKNNMEEAMNNIEELFSAAKDEMEFAHESVGSVYYHEDRVTAEIAVGECLQAFDKFLTDLPTDEMREEVQSKVGMKIKELQMEYESLPEEGG